MTKENKKDSIRIRCSIDEKELIKKLSKEQGLTMSEFILNHTLYTKEISRIELVRIMVLATELDNLNHNNDTGERQDRMQEVIKQLCGQANQLF